MKATIIDYTKMTKKQNPRIGKCPECGRKGEIVNYSDVEGRCHHIGKIELGLFNHIVDGCYWKNDRKESL